MSGVVVDEAHLNARRGRMFRTIWSTVAAGLVVLLGAARVGDEPLWVDEATSASIADRSFGGFVSVMYDQEAGMIPFHIMLWFWRLVFPSEAGMRMLAVVGAAVAVAMLFSLADRWFGRRIALFATVLTVANPYFLRYLTELRTYSWMMVVGIGLVVALDRLATRPSIGRALLVGLITGLGVISHVAFATFAAAVGAATFVVLPAAKRWRYAAAACAVAALVIMAAVPALLARSNQISWIRFTPRLLVDRTQDLIGGRVYVPVVAIGTFTALAAWTFNRTAARRRLGLVVVAAASMPVLVAVVSLVKPLYVERYLSACVPFVMLATAIGIDWLVTRWVERPGLRPAVLTVVLAIPTVAFVVDQPLADADRGFDQRAASQYVATHVDAGDLVLLDGYQHVMFRYYGAGPEYFANVPEPPTDDRLWTEVEPIGDFRRQIDESERVFVFRGRLRTIDPTLTEVMSKRSHEVVEFGQAQVIVIE